MTPTEYRDACDLVLGFARMINELPLDDMIASYTRALSVGPIVDPTLFAYAGASAADMRRVFIVARTFRDAVYDIAKVPR